MKLKKLKRTTKVRIESKGEYLLLMELAEKAGYKWCSGHKPTNFNGDEKYLKSNEIRFYMDKSMSYGDDADDDAVSLNKVIKFEVGDKVKIREDLYKFDDDEGPGIIQYMLDRAGKPMTISFIEKGSMYKRYCMAECDCVWIKKWIEPVLPEVEEEKQLKIDNFVKITACTTPAHHFPIGQIVEVVETLLDGRRFILRGYCEDRMHIDTQIVSPEDFESC